MYLAAQNISVNHFSKCVLYFVFSVYFDGHQMVMSTVCNLLNNSMITTHCSHEAHLIKHIKLQVVNMSAAIETSFK